MYKQILDQVGDQIDWMALLPLLLFFIVFSGVVFVVMTEKKAHVDYMANMPLQEDQIANEPQSE